MLVLSGCFIACNDFPVQRSSSFHLAHAWFLGFQILELCHGALISTILTTHLLTLEECKRCTDICDCDHTPTQSRRFFFVSRNVMVFFHTQNVKLLRCFRNANISSCMFLIVNNRSQCQSISTLTMNIFRGLREVDRSVTICVT